MASTMFYSLKNMIDTNIDHNIIEQYITKCIQIFSNSKQNQRGLITLLIRYYINLDNLEKVLEYLYMDGIMKRDYLTILKYFIEKNRLVKSEISSNFINVQEDSKTILKSLDTDIMYIYSKIEKIDTKDIDYMIDNGWIDLIKSFDGYPVMTSYNANDDGTNCYIYNMAKHIVKMRDIYVERIEVKDNNTDLTLCMKDVDIIIDGANMSYISGEFTPTELLPIIIKLESMGYKVKVVFHPTRKIMISELKPYLIFTPKFRNDDDYLLYGMLKFGKMILTNDMFRDHVKNMDIYTKCYIESKTIRYFKKNLIIPQYSKCIQVIYEDLKTENNGIYIPSINGGFYFLPSISASTPPPNNGAACIGVAILEIGCVK